MAIYPKDTGKKGVAKKKDITTGGGSGTIYGGSSQKSVAPGSGSDGIAVITDDVTNSNTRTLEVFEGSNVNIDSSKTGTTTRLTINAEAGGQGPQGNYKVYLYLLSDTQPSTPTDVTWMPSDDDPRGRISGDNSAGWSLDVPNDDTSHVWVTEAYYNPAEEDDITEWSATYQITRDGPPLDVGEVTTNTVPSDTDANVVIDQDGNTLDFTFDIPQGRNGKDGSYYEEQHQIESDTDQVTLDTDVQGTVNVWLNGVALDTEDFSYSNRVLSFVNALYSGDSLLVISGLTPEIAEGYEFDTELASDKTAITVDPLPTDGDPVVIVNGVVISDSQYTLTDDTFTFTTTLRTGDLFRVRSGTQKGADGSSGMVDTDSILRQIDTEYILAGANVTITNNENGGVTIASSGGGGGTDPYTAGFGLDLEGTEFSVDTDVIADTDWVASNFIREGETNIQLTGTNTLVQVQHQYKNVAAENDIWYIGALNGIKLDTNFLGRAVDFEVDTDVIADTDWVKDYVTNNSPSADVDTDSILGKIDTDYVRAGTNVTVTNNSDGGVTIAASGGGGGSGIPAEASGLPLNFDTEVIIEGPEVGEVTSWTKPAGVTTFAFRLIASGYYRTNIGGGDSRLITYNTLYQVFDLPEKDTEYSITIRTVRNLTDGIDFSNRPSNIIQGLAVNHSARVESSLNPDSNEEFNLDDDIDRQIFAPYAISYITGPRGNSFQTVDADTEQVRKATAGFYANGTYYGAYAESVGMGTYPKTASMATRGCCVIYYNSAQKT